MFPRQSLDLDDIAGLPEEVGGQNRRGSFSDTGLDMFGLGVERPGVDVAEDGLEAEKLGDKRHYRKSEDRKDDLAALFEIQRPQGQVKRRPALGQTEHMLRAEEFLKATGKLVDGGAVL